MNNINSVQLLLDSINKVKSFNKNVSSYPDSLLDLVSGRYTVDAKSLMGIFSLDLSKPIILRYKEDYEESVRELFGSFFYDKSTTN